MRYRPRLFDLGYEIALVVNMTHNVHIEDGVGYADFADLSEVIPNASTSCGSAGLLAQLDSTLTQFNTVTTTRYALDGDVEAFHEWVQLGAPIP